MPADPVERLVLRLPHILGFAQISNLPRFLEIHTGVPDVWLARHGYFYVGIGAVMVCKP